jgi:hypothetical protein
MAGGKTVLWVRPLDSRDARQLPGTEGSLESFWSPDRRSLAFAANGKLQRVDILGGLPQFLADARFLRVVPGAKMERSCSGRRQQRSTGFPHPAALLSKSRSSTPRVTS